MKVRDELPHCAAVGSVLGVVPVAHAAGKITPTVRGYGKIIHLPAKLAESPGHFKEEGRNVQLLNEGGNVVAGPLHRGTPP